ncbi:hypothetical protein BGZ63DRAFT_125031 [Mariannaea sp. PMI_226]|nr:hypothetical protein BGZ63DRAFT_125031 [Mariannaea sp. PMI_226]
MDQVADHLQLPHPEGIDRGVAMEHDKSEVVSSVLNHEVSNPSGDAGSGGPAGPESKNPPDTLPPKTTQPSAPLPSNDNKILPAPSESGAGGPVQSSTTATHAATTTGAASISTFSSEAAAHKTGGGGLGTGAIVGIVVGVVGGLLVIAIIAFIVLRKRGRNKSGAGYDGADTNNYMVDKETQGRTTDSPNSPYSDENQTRHVALSSLARDEPREERDLPRTSTSESHRRAGSSGGAQTPQGVSSNVAHLVEDGMTADEIRRLEEEERQLDDEIERAARR